MLTFPVEAPLPTALALKQARTFYNTILNRLAFAGPSPSPSDYSRHGASSLCLFLLKINPGILCLQTTRR